MIVVRLIGGIGNQMFQYAAGRRLSLKCGTELRLDTSVLIKDHGPNFTHRPFLLHRFEIKGLAIASAELEDFLYGEMANYKRLGNVLANKILHRPIFESERIFSEVDQNFEPEVLELPDDRYLRGYFQSELYFRDIRDVLLRDFQVRQEMNEANRRMVGIIEDTNSVCIHFRRGDYYSNPSSRKVHAVNLEDYYKKAIATMRDRVGECQFFLFSDEPNWVRENFNLGSESVIVDVNSPDEPEQDLRLMSLCKHFIIANSSFSWWGAWLSVNPNKVVIAPRRWFLDDRNTEDRCPKDWIRL